MKKITFFVLSVLTIGTCTAQQVFTGGDANGVGSDPYLSQGISNTTKSLGKFYGLSTIHSGYNRILRRNGRAVDGTRKNLHDKLSLNWNRGLIVAADGTRYEIPARYNPLTDEIEIKDQNQIYKLIKQDGLAFEFIDTNETYIAKSYLNESGIKTLSYFLKDKNALESEMLTKEDYFFVKSKNEFILKKKRSYYLVRGNKLVDLTTDRKSIKHNFPKQSKLILAFIRANKIKNEASHLSVLADYITNLESATNYNTLLASKTP